MAQEGSAADKTTTSAEGTRANAAKSRQKAKEIPLSKQEWRSTKRMSFVKGTGTNIPTTETGRLKGRDAKADTEADKVVFSKELHNQYVAHLTKYVNELVMMANSTDPRVKDALRNDPTHKIERDALALLSNEIVSKDGKTIRRIVDDTKIEAFLNKDEGMILTTMIMEKEAALEAFSLALTIANAPPGDKQDTKRVDRVFGRNVATGEDEGPIHHFVDATALPWLLQEMTSAGGRPSPLFGKFHITRGGVLAFDAGLFVAGTVLSGGNPLIGGGVAALGGLVEEMITLSRKGVRFEMHNCKAVFNSLTPFDHEYLRSVKGIEMDEFIYQDDILGGRLVNDPNYPLPRTEISPDERYEQMMSKLLSRKLFFKEIKVKEKLIDALPGQALYQKTKRVKFEQTGTHWEAEVKREYYARMQAIGIININDVETNTALYEEAKRTVIERRLNLFIASYAPEFQANSVKDFQGEDIFTKVDKKLKARKPANGQEAGEMVRKEKEKIEARKATLTADQAHFTEAQTTITAYQEAQRNLTTARQEAATALATIDPAPADINAAITELRRILRTPAGAPLQINGVVYNSIFDERNTIADNLRIALNAVPVANPRIGNEPVDSWNDRLNQARQNERDRFRPQQEIVDERARIFTDLVTQLQGIQTRIQTSEAALAPNGEATRNYDTTVQRQRTQFEEITTWAPGGGVPQITQAELLNLDVDAIILRINAINGQNNAMGWSEAQNGRPENRQRIVDAMNEARVRNIHPGSLDFNNFLSDVTEAEMRDLNDKDLFNLYNQRLVARGLPVWAAAMTFAHQATLVAIRGELPARFNGRVQALQENLRVKNEQITQQDDALRNINTGFTTEVNNLSRASEVMKRRDEIMLRCYGLNENEVNRDNMGFRLPINHANNANYALTTLSQAEGAAVDGAGNPVPRGYLEIMDMLFDYRSADHLDRGAYFNQIYQFLPPDTLATIINRNFQFGIAAPDIHNVINRLSLEIGLATLATYEIRQSFRGIINDIGNQVDSQPNRSLR